MGFHSFVETSRTIYPEISPKSLKLQIHGWQQVQIVNRVKNFSVMLPKSAYIVVPSYDSVLLCTANMIEDEILELGMRMRHPNFILERVLFEYPYFARNVACEMEEI